MKVWIGKYKHYIGPYQIAEWLENLCIVERDRDRIGEWLSNTWVSDFCQWIHSKQNRNVYVKIDGWDTWNLDHSLGLIILPALKQLKDQKQGYPLVKDEDVPEELRSTNASPKENEWDWVDNAEKRSDWVLDQMIWSFQQLMEIS